MNEHATTNRHRSLNNQLSEILHQYLMAVDSLHDNPLGDIEANLSRIEEAILSCRHIMLEYKKDYKGG